MPITTVSGPASRDEGVVMPWLMWCRGLAESSSPLITATGPANTRHIHQARQGKGDLKARLSPACPYHPWPHLQGQFLRTSRREDTSSFP